MFWNPRSFFFAASIEKDNFFQFLMFQIMGVVIPLDSYDVLKLIKIELVNTYKGVYSNGACINFLHGNRCMLPYSYLSAQKKFKRRLRLDSISFSKKRKIGKIFCLLNEHTQRCTDLFQLENQKICSSGYVNFVYPKICNPWLKISVFGHKIVG